MYHGIYMKFKGQLARVFSLYHVGLGKPTGVNVFDHSAYLVQLSHLSFHISFLLRNVLSHNHVEVI